MKLRNVKGFGNIRKSVVTKGYVPSLEAAVNRIMREVIFETRETFVVKNKKALIDGRYGKVVYLRGEDKYLLIGKYGVKKVTWDDMPYSVKDMIQNKTVTLVIEQ